MSTSHYIIIFIFALNFLNAQDTLYMTDGTKEIVKILEVNKTQIKYKPDVKSNGKTYVISKDDVLKIAYETGLIDVFPNSVTTNIIPDRKEDPRNTDFGRNFISLNVFDLLFSSLNIGYEYTFKSGVFSLKFPFSFRLNSKTSDIFNSGFGTGFDFYIYPFGQGKAKYFLGPSIVYRLLKEQTNYNAFLFQNGFLFQPSKHINLSINAGIGFDNIKKVARSKGGLNIGYKF